MSPPIDAPAILLVGQGCNKTRQHDHSQLRVPARPASGWPELVKGLFADRMASRSSAVRGVDISIAPGETVALLGPNGAGKSTTVDMMLGLSKPDAGTVQPVRRHACPEPSSEVRSARCCRRAACCATCPCANSSR